MRDPPRGCAARNWQPLSPGLEDDDNVVGDGSISTVSYCRILRDFVLNLISRLHCRPNPAGAP